MKIRIVHPMTVAIIFAAMVIGVFATSAASGLLPHYAWLFEYDPPAAPSGDGTQDCDDCPAAPPVLPLSVIDEAALVGHVAPARVTPSRS
jgi:hypothetical protein